ncbi:hypothetical protein [Desulfofalx alkaliphila]|uniref:hypothetical protein n=1 Tax=Desulfofalx alkaliphila TaxID=105483 RepID=UPI0012FF0A5B|nr:hypothetical protein [Desulfofalx alkaliphila]
MNRKQEDNYPLEGTTWAYPKTGFWVSHLIGIMGVGYMGYMIGKNLKGGDY